MKRSISLVVSLLALCMTFTSCIDEEQYDDTPQGNFEALWKIIDDQ